ASVLRRVEPLLAQAPYLKGMRWLATDDVPTDMAEAWDDPKVDADALAFLQYTSGSTTTPRGVMLSHANLLHNQRMIESALPQPEESIIVSWLPLYHDMGLIGTTLHSLYKGARCVLMSPGSFLQRPFRWLQAISRYKATTSGAPNFAYDLCCHKVKPEEMDLLDLSSWSVAFNGAEPVRAETMDLFAATFASRGFRREAFHPCYGLAEATLIVSGKKSGGPMTREFEASRLGLNQVKEASASDRTARRLSSCGKIAPGQNVVIVNPESRTRCSRDEVGEIWISGPHVAQGYWNLPDETGRTFRAFLSDTGEGPFLRTGDLGFFADDELLVTGRLKDLIIIRGRNHYPQDIENTVQARRAALRPGCGAAFSVEVEGEERLVIVQEVDHPHRLDLDALVDDIRQAVAEAHELQTYSVALIKPGSILKTSSGKIQHFSCKAAFLDGALDAVKEWRASKRAITFDGEGPLSLAAAFDNPEAVQDWLVSLLSSKLGLDRSSIDVTQPISRYGLDSLSSLEIVHSIESTLNVNSSMASILQGVSIAELADHLLTQMRVVPEVRQVVARRAASEHALSWGQRALWLLHNLSAESAACNIARAVRVRSTLNVAALRAAFQALVDRHSILRTTITSRDGEPSQVIHERMEVFFLVEDASAWGEDAMSRRLVEEAHRPFDLERESGLRILLFAIPDKEAILLLVVHHIVTDFWSLALMTQELGELYRAQTDGGTIPSPGGAPQYTDYIKWQTEMLESGRGERLWDFWKDQLSGELPPLNLPTDKRRPPIKTYRGAAENFRLSSDLSRKLKAVAGERETTLYTALLAAFQVLLYRYTGQEDILVGSPTSGRSISELANILGYLVNPVVMRGDLSGQPTFEQFLGRTRRAVLSAFEHQDYPFALLVERLAPALEPSRSRLYEVMFVFQKAHHFADRGLAALALGEAGAEVKVGALSLESIPLEQLAAQFDLTLTMAEIDGLLAGSIQYNTDLFDRATINRLAAHFENLLGSAVTDPWRRVSDLSILTEAERRQLLIEWNDTRLEFADRSFVHQVIEGQALKTPDAAAITCEGEHLSYKELNGRANRLANFLVSIGAGPDTLVGICMERSLEMVVGVLAVLKSGGAYVPIDTAYPRERKSFIIADAGLSVILTLARHADGFAAQAEVVSLDADWPAIASYSDENPASLLSDDNLAYVIYTSGTTGKPKGAMNTHGGIRNRLLWMQEQYRLTEADAVLQKTPFTFDVSVWELLWPLMAGARLVMARPDGHKDGAYLAGLIAEQNITTLHFVPSMLQAFLEEPDLEGCKSLRRVICSGESLSSQLQERFHARLMAELHNLYGPTEAAIDVTFRPCRREDHREIIPIGRPISNTRIYVLDKSLGIVPLGVAGELHIGGDGLARGYLNRPELTADKFIPDPFGGAPGARLYRTGDLARYLVSGELEFLGRIDHQVKIRGVRVELGEIEQTLVQHGQVRECVVVAGDDSAGNKRLVAYVVCEQSAKPTSNELRAYLSARLPEYMIPSVFMTIEQMPLSANGKIDRNALPAVDRNRPKVEGSNQGPRDWIEEVLASIWSELLDSSPVNLDDNFFDLGGHSLLAARLAARVRDSLRADLSLADVFDNPTPRSLSALVAQRLSGGKARSRRPITRADRTGPLPPSFAQQRMWFLQQLEPDSTAYNMAARVRMEGDLDVGALAASLRDVVGRHESLRTRFVLDGGRLAQVVEEGASLDVGEVDLSGLCEGQRERERERIVREEAGRRIDLGEAPVMRAKVIRLGEGEWEAVASVHHIACDGWSVGVMCREVGELYSGYSRGEAVDLGEVRFQYADYAVWERGQAGGEEMKEQLRYWKEELEGAPEEIRLPADRARVGARSSRGGRQRVEVSEEVRRGLKEVGRRAGASLNMALMGVMRVLLSRYSGESDIVVGSVVANRRREGMEGVVGVFVNTVAMRSEVREGMSYEEVLRREKEVAESGWERQEVGFDVVVEEVRPKREAGRTPIFQVLFNMLNFGDIRLDLPGVTVEFISPPEVGSKLDMTLYAKEEENKIKLELVYNNDIFNEQRMSEMLAQYVHLLSQIVENPKQEITSYSLVTPSARLLLPDPTRELVSAWAGSILEMFASHARSGPDRAAISDQHETWSYQELDSFSNRVANYLRASGVRTEDVIAVLGDRSPALVGALLGIMKAGAAFTILDPSQSASWLVECLEAVSPKGWVHIGP
ncbi:MAG TPA: amino acid adenylation domain-containing protein, partial [Blastocatellia bacterium]|nr:amino acid adenylation domain-containing protein [Blastocatellia bacterium]